MVRPHAALWGPFFFFFAANKTGKLSKFRLTRFLRRSIHCAVVSLLRFVCVHLLTCFAFLSSADSSHEDVSLLHVGRNPSVRVLGDPTIPSASEWAESNVDSSPFDGSQAVRLTFAAASRTCVSDLFTRFFFFCFSFCEHTRPARAPVLSWPASRLRAFSESHASARCAQRSHIARRPGINSARLVCRFVPFLVARCYRNH